MNMGSGLKYLCFFSQVVTCLKERSSASVMLMFSPRCCCSFAWRHGSQLSCQMAPMVKTRQLLGLPKHVRRWKSLQQWQDQRVSWHMVICMMCHVMPNHLHECLSNLCNLNLLRSLEGSIGSMSGKSVMPWSLKTWTPLLRVLLPMKSNNEYKSTIIKLANQSLKISTFQSTTLNQEVPYMSISYNSIEPGKDFIAFQSLTLSTKVMKPYRMRWNRCGTTWSWPWILRGCDVGRVLLDIFEFEHHPWQLCIALSCGNPKVTLYFMCILGKLTLFRSMEWNLVTKTTMQPHVASLMSSYNYASQLVV